MPMEQWPGPPRDEDTDFGEAPEDEPGDWLLEAQWELPPQFEGEMSGPEYWLNLGKPYPPKAEDEE